MGANRDLKKATEAYWGGKLSQAELLSEAKRLRLEHWNIQKKAGVDVIPSNDFALYDQVLTHIQDFGVSLSLSSSSIFKVADSNFTFPHRLPLQDILLRASILSMNTLLWAVATRRVVLTCLPWRW